MTDFADLPIFAPGFEIIPKVDISGIDPADLSDEDLARLLSLKAKLDVDARTRKFEFMFPGIGPMARQYYKKHMTFFALGSDYKERCFMAANRVGKTMAGAYELTCHLTGKYPDWWVGKRFDRPIRAWVAGGSKEETRDILQTELFGTVGYEARGVRRQVSGEGMVPLVAIDQGGLRWKSGVNDALDTARVRHISGGWSIVGFKSYAQGRKSFQGVARDVIWLDEECPEDVYEECLIRTATTNGIIMLTFTPLMGLTKVVLGFLPSNYHALCRVEES